jgi:hypothetical protein
MTTLLQAAGMWDATPTAVAEGTWTVVVSVPDPAANVWIARQALALALAAGAPRVTGGAPGVTGGAGEIVAPILTGLPSITQ